MHILFVVCEVESEGSCSKELDARICYRLHMCIWKQWKTPQNRIKNLMKLRVDKDTAWITAYTGSRIAYICQRRVMNFPINKERLTRFGLLELMAIDYKKPVKVISEDEKFMKQIEKWAVEE